MNVGFEIPMWYKKYNKHHIIFRDKNTDKTCSQCLHYVKNKNYCNVWEDEKHSGNSFSPKEQACYLFEKK